MKSTKIFSACMVLLAGSLNAGAPLRTRSFSFEYTAAVDNIPPSTKEVDLWIPAPQDDASQTITNLRVTSPFPFTLTESPDGNRILHIQIHDPDKLTYSLSLTFDARRKERERPDGHAFSRPPGGDDHGNFSRWLQPDHLVPIDGQIRKWAEQVIADANAHTDLEMAQAIYNHVVSTVKYDKSGKGWGRGDIYYACDARRGNCTDFHAIFIGYCRALGIPARFAIGFPLPADRGEGKIAGYHCWAEFYAKGIGWIPIDASEAAKNPAKREYFFGHHDENRIEFSRGRDVTLAPKQAGDPLNFFIYPYAEIDGKPYAGTRYSASYGDLVSTSSVVQKRFELRKKPLEKIRYRRTVPYTVHFRLCGKRASKRVDQEFFCKRSQDGRGRYRHRRVRLAHRMPVCRSLGEGIWEARSNISDGIARVLFSFTKAISLYCRAL